MKLARHQVFKLALVLVACALLGRLRTGALTSEPDGSVSYDPDGPTLILKTRDEGNPEAITGLSQGGLLLLRTHKDTYFSSGTPLSTVEAALGRAQFNIPQTSNRLAWELKTAWPSNGLLAGKYLWIRFGEDSRAEAISVDDELFFAAYPYGDYARSQR